MKFIMTAIMALSITATSMAADVSHEAFDALLNYKTVQLRGDVQADETVGSIVFNGLTGAADIKNECATTGADEVSCTLWIVYPQMGETAVEYKVNAAGTALQSDYVNVSRGH